MITIPPKENRRGRGGRFIKTLLFKSLRLGGAKALFEKSRQG